MTAYIFTLFDVGYKKLYLSMEIVNILWIFVNVDIGGLSLYGTYVMVVLRGLKKQNFEIISLFF